VVDDANQEGTLKNYHEALKNLLRDDSGQDLIEYALVAALIGLGAAVALKPLGGYISTIFTNIGTTLTSAT
jgi:pilus assembly protein Flp/PilA